jgi:lipoprotein signal peptidase
MTRFWFFSDRFVLPEWMKYHVAFSLGDVFIALGVVWLLWTLGGKIKENKQEKTS